MTILRDPGGGRLFLEGRLEGVSVPDLIHAVCLPRTTGTLAFSRGDVSKTLYIREGQIIFASSTVAEERLGETLLRSGAVGYGQLEKALEFLGTGKRLGSILVELGYLTPPNLVRGLLYQVKEIILSLFPWESADYSFTEGPLPTAEVVTLNISTSRIIWEGIRRIASWPRIARGVGPSSTAYRLTREGRLLAEDLDLGAAERALLDALEKPVTVGEICRGVFLPNFDVYQYLWVFRILGVIRHVETPAEAPFADPSQPGRTRADLRHEPLGLLLVDLCQKEETGVLLLTREAEEKAIHIKAGKIVFATTNRPDQFLTTFLLRRGVIGLHEKEEIERRQLSNKRAGTMLREMGILSQEELTRYVREQLREIVVSAFAWERGEWLFESGELPTFEEIALDSPVGDLILQGVRSVKDWTRIRAGCGDPETILYAAAGQSTALGGVDLGPDESEVLAALGSSRKVGEVCESTQLSSYRVAQILWGLQTLGAVTRSAADAALGAGGSAHEPEACARLDAEGSEPEAKLSDPRDADRISKERSGLSGHGMPPERRSVSADASAESADDGGEDCIVVALAEPGAPEVSQEDETGSAVGRGADPLAESGGHEAVGQDEAGAATGSDPSWARPESSEAVLHDSSQEDRWGAGRETSVEDGAGRGADALAKSGEHEAVGQDEARAATGSDPSWARPESSESAVADRPQQDRWGAGRETSVEDGAGRGADPSPRDRWGAGGETSFEHGGDPAPGTAWAGQDWTGSGSVSEEGGGGDPAGAWDARPGGLREGDPEHWSDAQRARAAEHGGAGHAGQMPGTIETGGIREIEERVFEDAGAPGASRDQFAAEDAAETAGRQGEDAAGSDGWPASGLDAADPLRSRGKKAPGRTVHLSDYLDQEWQNRRPETADDERHPSEGGENQDANDPGERDARRREDSLDRFARGDYAESSDAQEQRNGPLAREHPRAPEAPEARATKEAPDARDAFVNPRWSEVLPATDRRESPRSPLEAVGTGILEEIERFNRRQREVYAVLRGEVGAGARNLVATCITRLDRTINVFTDLSADETGAFSPSALYERVASWKPATIRMHLEALITAEMDIAKTFLNVQSVQKIYRGLASMAGDPIQRR